MAIHTKLHYRAGCLDCIPKLACPSGHGKDLNQDTQWRKSIDLASGSRSVKSRYSQENLLLSHQSRWNWFASSPDLAIFLLAVLIPGLCCFITGSASCSCCLLPVYICLKTSQFYIYYWTTFHTYKLYLK